MGPLKAGFQIASQQSDREEGEFLLSTVALYLKLFQLVTRGSPSPRLAVLMPLVWSFLNFYFY